ncbi:unnamed protein product [Haemonchus placei]|uniref:Helicase C-terminal domain-containing protein n=1 Tax=Haemonchus placei TaxID=6290 RepID=A0A0N4WYF4_HAEPC|nr:unnamed protein product [Haemonchus placei]
MIPTRGDLGLILMCKFGASRNAPKLTKIALDVNELSLGNELLAPHLDPDSSVEDDADLLQLANYKHQSTILNLLVQLRKSVAHPYLFRGIEPEPFREGEHLVAASGKLQVLDILLRYLKKHKHRCLIFSQFVIFLDIVDDFMNLRGYKFERIDGQIQADDRYAAINKFQNGGKNRTKNNGHSNDDDDPWCFLMSTKTGGVGLNLTRADTVIFLDADWNPQNDIQAMARCHRIGQDKPVRVIQLIGRYTVEQHMNARIRNKLKFTDKVMGNEEKKLSAYHVMATVKRNLGALKEQDSENIEMTDQDLESIIGETNANGEWLPLKGEKENEIPIAARINPDEVDTRDTDFNDYRVFEGRDYRISAKDEAESEKLQLSDYEEEDDMETPEEIKETKKDRASSTSPVKVENNENGSVDEVESDKKFTPKLGSKREDENSKNPKVEKSNRKRELVIDENEGTQKAAAKRKRSNGAVLLRCN